MKLVFCIIVVIVIAVTAHALTAKQRTEQSQWNHECKSETGVLQDSLNKFHHGEFTDDPKFRAYVLCFFKKAEFLDDSGELVVDEIKKSLKKGTRSDDAFDQEVSKCDVKMRTWEETTFEAYKCLCALNKQ